MTIKQYKYIVFLMDQLDFRPIDNIVDGINRAWLDTEEKLAAIPDTELSILIDFLRQAHEVRTDTTIKYATDKIVKLKIINEDK